VAVVVNHLHLRDPLTEEMAQAFRDFTPRIVDAGASAAQAIRVDDKHIILLLEFVTPSRIALLRRRHRLLHHLLLRGKRTG